MMQYRRIVDLTQPLVPGQGTRPLVIERGRTEELTVHTPVDHPWYIMHRVQTISHIGRTSRRQIAAKLGIAASTESRLTHVFEDPALAVAIADGMITKSQA